MTRLARVKRSRHRQHRRRSRRFSAFCAEMATKWNGQESTLTANVVAANVMQLSGVPTTSGPYRVRGAVPPELRGLDRFWIEWNGSNHATLYKSLKDLGRNRSPIVLASWPVSAAVVSLTADTDAVASTSAGTTVATVGAALAISAVTNGDDTLTRVGHGFVLDQGPFYVASDTTIPAGLAALTPYWIAEVTTANTFKLAASQGGAIINLTSDGAGAITIAPVNVDLDDNQLAKTAHGITTGQIVRVTTDGVLPGGLAINTDYYAVAVSVDLLAFATSLVNAQAGTKINLTSAGSGTTTVVKVNVDLPLNILRFSAAHGLATGDGPVRLTTDGVLPTGLAAATDYYAIATSATELKLATTEANALALTAIDITAIGSGTQTVTLAGVDVTEDSLRIVAHGMQTGDGPVRISTAGVLPTGLAAATDYWVIRHSANYIGLATSQALAIAGTEVNITGIGTGAHTLLRAVTIGRDLTADAFVEWLAQGVSRDQMVSGLTANVATIFV